MEKYEADIVIVDDGVNVEPYSLGTMLFDIEIDNDLSITTRKAIKTFLLSHGTTCAAIIKRYAADAVIGSIKVISEQSRRGVKYKLLKAIEWCTENKIRLINLSLGTIDFRDFDEIQNCVNEAAAKGLIIVAACNNKNVYTVPACLSNAIGVKCKNIYNDDQFSFNIYPFDGIDISASGRHLLTDAYGSSTYTNPSNSFAAPLITAKVYELIKKNPAISLAQIKKNLSSMAINIMNEEYNPNFYMNIDWEFNNHDPFIQQQESKFWNKELYVKRVNSYNEKPDVLDIPVISVYGHQDVGSVVDELYNCFYSDGYYCVRVSSNYNDLLKKYEYLPDSVPAKKLLSLVYSKYNCDIILLKIENEDEVELIEKNMEVDIKLHITENKTDVIYENDSIKNTIEFGTSFCKAEFINIYSKILSCLNGD